MKIVDFAVGSADMRSIEVITEPPATDEVVRLMQENLKGLNMPSISLLGTGRIRLDNPAVWAMQPHMDALKISLENAWKTITDRQEQRASNERTFLNKFREAAGLAPK